MRFLALLTLFCSLFASHAFAQNPPIGGGTGTVTAVGLSMPSMFTVTGSPVNTSGTLAASLASQAANVVFASPNGASGAPVFRTLVNADINASAAIAGTKLAAASVLNSALANMAVLTIKSNIGASPNIPADNTMTQILDAVFGTTRGQILYRGASAWTALAPGASGTFLGSNGAGADPSYLVVPPTGLGNIGANTILGNPSGSTAAPTAAGISNYLDGGISSVPGSIATRGASGWIMGTDMQGFRNVIVNGNMRLDYRNFGATCVHVLTVRTYCLDQWYITDTGALTSLQRVDSTVADFRYMMQWAGAIGNTNSTIGQRIESDNTWFLQNQNATLSATMFSSSGTTSIVWTISCANALNNWTGTTLVASGTWNITTLQTRFIAPLTFNSCPSNGVQLTFSAGAFSSLTDVNIVGVQLEKGNTATDFENLDIANQNARAFRYYYGGNYVINTYSGTIGTAAGSIQFPVSMVAAPSVALTSTSSTNCIGTSASNIGTLDARLSCSAATIGQSINTGFYTAKSEF